MKPSVLSLALVCVVAGCSKSERSSTNTTGVASTTTATTGSIGSVTSSSSGTTATTTPPPPSFQAVSFDVLEEGQSTLRAGLGAHEVHVATDSDWAAFWPTHATTRPPVVDFTQSCVIGTFMGQVNTGGYSTEVINVWRDTNSDDLRVLVRSFRPGDWRPVPSVITSPFQLVECETVVTGQGSLAAGRQALLDFETLAAGSNSALGAGNPAYTGGLYVFRDDAAYTAFYAQIQPGVRPPPVNFAVEHVVAVLGPYVPSFGNSVETLRLVHDVSSDQIRVRFRVNPYRGGAAPPPATETPFQVLRVSRASGPVRVELETPLVLPTPTAGLARTFTGPAESRVVRDAAEFAALWAANVGGTPPTVDFAVDQVLVHFEPGGSSRSATIARAVQLEDDELAVTVTTRLSSPTRDGRYSLVVVPKSFGPVGFELVDVTPRP